MTNYQEKIGKIRNNQEIKRIRDQEEKDYKQFLLRTINQNGSIKILNKA